MAKKEKKAKKPKEKKEKKGKLGRRARREKEPREPKTAYDSAVSTLGGFVCGYAIFLIVVFLFIVAYAVLSAL